MIICAGSIFADYISKIDKFPKKPIKVLSSGIVFVEKKPNKHEEVEINGTKVYIALNLTS